MNVRSAQRALKTSSLTCAPTVAAGSSRDQSGRQRTGRATIFSARTPRAPKSSTGRLILRFMRCSQVLSGIFHQRTGSAPQTLRPATVSQTGARRRTLEPARWQPIATAARRFSRNACRPRAENPLVFSDLQMAHRLKEPSPSGDAHRRRAGALLTEVFRAGRDNFRDNDGDSQCPRKSRRRIYLGFSPR